MSDYYGCCNSCPVLWDVHQNGVIASVLVTVTSDFEVWCGQINRSSDNFEVPESGEYLINAPKGVSFDIWHDFTGAPDKYKGRFEGGKIVELTGKSWKTLNIPSRYYIGNPKGATAFFDVTFIKKR